MTTHSAVSVDDDLATGEAGVTLRSADDEAAGGIDVKLDFLDAQVLGDDLLDHFADDCFPQLLGRNVFRVLGRDDHGLDADRKCALVENGDLRLTVRPYPAPILRAAEFGETFGETMGELYRHGHQLLSLIGRVTKHHTLITRTTRVDALCDVR